MPIHSELLLLILVLTLNDQVHTGEIIGGHEAAPHSRPYMVLLERTLQDGIIRFCGGFLLNEEFVMTAAHCQAKSYKVLLGAHSARDKNNPHISSETAIAHEEYNENDQDYKNDIMLLKLSSKATYDENVRPIDLADEAEGSLPKICNVSGWGIAVRNSSYMSVKLMEVNVTLIDSEQCPGEHVYCSEGDSGPRKGDSGGPLVCEDGKAYGVVSTGRQNPEDLPIYTYTKIPYYRNWIDSTMKKHGTRLHM